MKGSIELDGGLRQRKSPTQEIKETVVPVQELGEGDMTPDQLFWFMWRIILSWRFWSISFCLVLTLVDKTVSYLIPALMGSLIDAITRLDNMSKDDPRLAEVMLEAIDIFLLWTVCTIATTILNMTLGYANGMVDTFINFHTQYLALLRVLRMDMDFFAHPLTQVDAIPSRTADQSLRLNYFVRDLPFHLVTTVYGLLVIPFFASRASTLNWSLILVNMWMQPFSFIIIQWQNKLAADVTVQQDNINADIKAAVFQLAKNVKFIKMCSATDEAVTVRKLQHYKSFDLQRYLIRVQTALGAMTTCMTLAISAFTYYTIIWSIYRKEMTYGEFTAFTSYLGMFSSNLANLYKIWGNYKRTTLVVTNVVTMLSTPIGIEKEEAAEIYKTDRTRKDEASGMIGSDISKTIRAVLRGRKKDITWLDYANSWLDGPLPLVPDLLPWNIPRSLDSSSDMVPHPEPWSIEFRDVCFRYNRWMAHKKDKNLYVLPRVHDTSGTNEMYILDRVSFKIQPSEHVVIRGPNGCGKSTTLGLIMRMFEPHRGEVLVNGENVRQMSVKNLRRMQGIMTQKPPVLMGTVVSNCYFGENGTLVTPEEMKRRQIFLEALRTASRLPFHMKMTEELAKSRDPSDGEAQKIQLLRLFRRPYSVLLFDEPTNHLDVETLECLFDWFHTLKSHRGMPGYYAPTIVIISHDERLIRHVDRAIVLEDTDHAKAERRLQAAILEKEMKKAEQTANTAKQYLQMTRQQDKPIQRLVVAPAKAAIPTPAPASAADAVNSTISWMAAQ